MRGKTAAGRQRLSLVKVISCKRCELLAVVDDTDGWIGYEERMSSRVDIQRPIG